MAKTTRCILNLDQKYPLMEIFSSIDEKEINKLNSFGLSKKEINSYQKRGKKIYQKVSRLKNISFKQGNIIIGNELFGLGGISYHLVKELSKNPDSDLLPIEKKRVLDVFSSQYGDSLSKNLLIFSKLKLNELNYLFLEQTKIPKELLLRTMSKKTYFEYLNGKIPVFYTESKEYRLPIYSNLEMNLF